MNRIHLILIALLFCTSSSITLNAQTPFVTIWNTTLPGASGPNQIIFPADGFFFDIVWEEVGNPGNNGYVLADFDQTTITFPDSGIYRVSITPGFGFIQSFKLYLGGDQEKLIDVEQWGTIPWSSLTYAFSSCHSLDTISATDIPNFSEANSISNMFYICDSLRYINLLPTWDLGTVTNIDGLFGFCSVFNQDISALDVGQINSMAFTFESATLFNQDISTWDVSNVTIMLGMFSFADNFNQDIGVWNTENVVSMDMMFMEADSFNQDIGNWNTSKVTGMFNMFWSAANFNQDIGDWDVSKVTAMEGMFFLAEAFNQDIGDWDVSRVVYMSDMFLSASAFNQDIGDWDVSAVINMSQMFAFAESFNQDISRWDVSKVGNMYAMLRGLPDFNQDLRNWEVDKVTNMSYMFEGCTSFNQPLGAWQLRPAVNLTHMLDMTGMDCTNYSSTLTGWAGNPTTPANLILGADGITFGTGAITARNTLLSKGWTILDEGEDSGCPYDPIPFISIWDTEASGISSNTQVTIPAMGSNYTIEWEEVGNTINSGSTTGNGNTTITFPSAGKYRIYISSGAGNFNGIIFNNNGDRQKLQQIEQWGTAEWTNLEGAFYGCTPLTITASDVLTLDGVPSMKNMFRECTSLSRVPNMHAWATGSVTNMDSMLLNATTFNQPIGQLDVANVTSMRSMFEGATLFNKNIADWDVSLVEDMSRMFYNASSFNQPITMWNTSVVENMAFMFYNAIAFDQRLDQWDIGALDPMVSPMEGMLSFSGMQCKSYSFSLAAWATAMNTPDDIELGADGINYSFQVAPARTILTSTNGWTIIDAGQDLDCELYSDDFITIWKSNNPGSSNINQIKIPATGTNYTIEWEDVDDNSTQGTLTASGMATVTFPSAGTYRVRIRPGAGSFHRILMYTSGDQLKLTEIENWGNISWSSMDNAFYTCANLSVTTQDTIKLSSATSTRSMFQGCTNITNVPYMEDWNMSTITTTALMFYGASNFDHPIGGWNVSNVLDMSYMFYQAAGFNQYIGGWNTTKVTNMNNMFNNATSFNQDIGNWNTGNVLNMSMMFKDAFSFNQDLTWNTIKVTNMSEMFHNAISFNGNIANWNTKKVQTMSFMFSDASAFNGDLSLWQTDSLKQMFSTFQNAVLFNSDIGGWNTSKVTTMFNLFQGAVSFNQDIGAWNTGKVTQMTSMFDGVVGFNQDISGWDVSKVTSMSSMFNNVHAFNQDIGNWNTGAVTSMFRMFGNAIAFNQDLDTWDVSKVTNPAAMFSGATSFNGNIENWNTGAMTSLTNMFEGATSFAGDLGNWDVSNVSFAIAVFNGATSFNGDIEDWQTGSMTNISNMFAGASSFDRDLGGWAVDSVVNITGFLSGAGLSTAHYDSLLIRWSTQNLKPNLIFDAGASQYCTGEAARDQIIAMHGWTIHDDGKNCCSHTTTWSGSGWDNGAPTEMHLAIFTGDYNTDLHGNLQACSMAILPGVTVIVEANDMVEVESLLDLGGILHVKELGNVIMGE